MSTEIRARWLVCAAGAAESRLVSDAPMSNFDPSL